MITALLCMGIVVHLAVATVIWYGVASADMEYWQQREDHVHGFDEGTSVIFGFMVAMLWPLTIPVLILVSLPPDGPHG